jgi:hypothetical protein
MPGNLVWTRFGECVVSAYRPADDMVLVTLGFCNPPATAWLYYKEIVNIESMRAAAEGHLMAEEDRLAHLISAAERIHIKKELYLVSRRTIAA